MKKNNALYGILLSISGVVVAAGPASEPGFDFINKSGKTLTILVNNGYKNILQAVVKPAVTVFGKVITANNVSATIDINEPTLLVVYEGAYTTKVEPFRPRGGDEGTPAFFYDWMVHGPKAKTYMYTFKLGKKAYVTLHENGNLNPQSGPRSGATGKTDAGYSLENEVSQSDIMRASESYMGL
ncbi:MAG TPA: hypothetical protein VKR54_04185 [Candidatus Babeliales bacterium]|jgi:hypothetical protein|nr:hypothetical protein [Candidatus Babeliales bacterium]